MSDELDVFREEALELIDSIEQNLMVAEKRPENWEDPISVIFGAIHTIKGNSLYLNLDVLSLCCQKLESLLADEDRNPRLPSPEEFDVLFQSVDVLRAYCSVLGDVDDLDEANTMLIRWLAENNME